MGMKQKIDRAFQEGYKEGEKVAAEYAEIRGVIKGSMETWEIVEKIFADTPGIGPKTKLKLLKIIQEYADNTKKEMKGGKF